MPIYEYRCGECGFQKEFLQKVSDAPLRDCPQCGRPALSKLLSAAGFQLKGTGWYATDFRNSGAKPGDGAASGKSDSGKQVGTEAGKGDSASGGGTQGTTAGGAGTSPAGTSS